MSYKQLFFRSEAREKSLRGPCHQRSGLAVCDPAIEESLAELGE